MKTLVSFMVSVNVNEFPPDELSDKLADEASDYIGAAGNSLTSRLEEIVAKSGRAGRNIQVEVTVTS